MTNYDELVSLLKLSDPDSVYAQAASAITRLQADLKEALEIISWFIENDETNEGDEPLESKNGATWNEINAYWIGGLNRGRDFVSKHEGKKG